MINDFENYRKTIDNINILSNKYRIHKIEKNDNINYKGFQLTKYQFEYLNDKYFNYLSLNNRYLDNLNEQEFIKSTNIKDDFKNIFENLENLENVIFFYNYINIDVSCCFIIINYNIKYCGYLDTYLLFDFFTLYSYTKELNFRDRIKNIN